VPQKPEVHSGWWNLDSGGRSLNQVAMQASVNAPETLIAKIVQGQSVAPLANERLNQTRNSPPVAPPRKIAHSSCLCRFGTTLVGTMLEHTGR